jgi:hypothetical protein
MASDADLPEPSLALPSNKRLPRQSPPWLVAPSASAARHLHRAVTSDATVATRYAGPDARAHAKPPDDKSIRLHNNARSTGLTDMLATRQPVSTGAVE